MMAKIYQPRKNNENWIPHTLYMRVICAIRDYDRMVDEYNDKLAESPAPADGMPHSTQIGDPTSRKAFKVETLHDNIVAIDEAVNSVPLEYRQPILDNIKYNVAFPDYANRKTWIKWKGRLIRRAGENLNLI